MDANERRALESVYREWSDGALLNALECRTDEYRPEALAVMRSEISRRGLKASDPKVKASAPLLLPTPEEMKKRLDEAVITEKVPRSYLWEKDPPPLNDPLSGD